MAKEILELVDGKVRVKERKRSKYRNVRTQVDGLKFDSKSEAKRWKGLQMMEKAGLITKLSRQVRFPLTVNGLNICTYVADFVYWSPLTHPDRAIVEDVKGSTATQTEAFRIKRKLMRACYGIDILITGKNT